MRVQTILGGIISGTNERLFGPALVLLRVAFGGLLLEFAIAALNHENARSAANTLFQNVIGAVALHPASLVFWIVSPLVIIGALFIAGLLTRPASIALLIVFAAIDAMLLPMAVVKSLVFPELLLVSVACMGISGGMGGAFGLNGLILRNIRNPGALISFLFS